jgi:HAE1 family hydrophobic/amphiphilic exporter-1
MRRLVAFSVRNRVLVNLLTLLIIGVGGVTALQMHREIFPEFSLQGVRVATAYPGASPEEIEKLITAKIETEVAELDGLHELLSVSQEGLSEILLKNSVPATPSTSRLQSGPWLTGRAPSCLTP